MSSQRSNLIQPNYGSHVGYESAIKHFFLIQAHSNNATCGVDQKYNLMTSTVLHIRETYIPAIDKACIRFSRKDVVISTKNQVLNADFLTLSSSS